MNPTKAPTISREIHMGYHITYINYLIKTQEMLGGAVSLVTEPGARSRSAENSSKRRQINLWLSLKVLTYSTQSPGNVLNARTLLHSVPACLCHLQSPAQFPLVPFPESYSLQ
jgi:hypothetical protein